MELDIIEKKESNDKCVICNSMIENENFETIEICENCRAKFSTTELQTIIKLLKQYGGYYGQLRRANMTLNELLKDFLESLRKNNDYTQFVEQFIMLNHKALIYGFTQKELIEALNKYL